MNIFQKTCFIAALLVGQAAMARAQQAVSAEWGRGDELNVELKFTNNLYVPIIIHITFQNPSSFGGGIPSPYTTSMSARGTASVKLPRKENADYAYSYRYWWGCRSANIDADYPYLLPLRVDGKTKIGKLRLFDKSVTVPAKNFYAIALSASKGDTVYAARRGTVFNLKSDADLKYSGYSLTTDENEMYIIHKDCSYARYSVLNKILAREGQKVEAGEAIAIVGGDKYASGSHVRFSVMFPYFCDTCKNQKGAYGSAYLEPKFYQKDGVVDTLPRADTLDGRYPDEIITREMSRRELKKWRKK